MYVGIMSTQRAQVVDPWLTRVEVATELQVSTRTVDRYISEGVLVATRLPGGRLVRIRRSALRQLTNAFSSPVAAPDPSHGGRPDAA